MALPRKGTRPISVAEEEYRYVVSTSRSAKDGVFKLNLTVQSGDGQGALLLVQGLLTRDVWLDFPEMRDPPDYVVLTSKHIATAIKIARARGWQPHEAGRPFVLPVTEQDLSEAHHVAEKHSDTCS